MWKLQVMYRIKNIYNYDLDTNTSEYIDAYEKMNHLNLGPTRWRLCELMNDIYATFYKLWKILVRTQVGLIFGCVILSISTTQIQ
jgi:hypothetical protein